MLTIAGDYQRKKLSLTIASRGEDEVKVMRKAPPLTLVIAGGTGRGTSRKTKLTISGRGKQGMRERRMSLAGRQTVSVSTTTRVQSNSFFVIDSFGQEATFSGTTAATIFLSSPADYVWMQSTATQLNVKQLSFVSPLGSNADEFSIRAFSPTIEVDLPGHSAVAAAKALLDRNSSLFSVQLHSKSGLIVGRISKSGDISLTYPRNESVIVASKTVADGIKDFLCNALGVCPSTCVQVQQTKYDTVLVLNDDNLVANCIPNFTKLATFPTRAVTVTSLFSGKADVIARSFSSTLGISATIVDPSAVAYLVPFWAPLLNKRTVEFANGTQSLIATLEGDHHATQTVTVTGSAEVIVSSELKSNNFLKAKL